MTAFDYQSVFLTAVALIPAAIFVLAELRPERGRK